MLAHRRPEQYGEGPPGVELQTIELPSRRRIRVGIEWLGNRRPLGAAHGTEEMASAVRAVLAQRSFDVAHVIGWPLAELSGLLSPLPAVLTTFDAWHLNYTARVDTSRALARPLLREEARRIARFEAQAYAPYRSVIVVSEEDGRALRELNPALAIEVISNGVDGERFAPRPDVVPEPGLVVFTGAMHWAPNVAAARLLAREVLPRLRARRPEAHLAIVGRSPSEEVIELGAEEGVEVVGEVPDIAEWLARASAYACPMVSGTGIKNKLLEAMACECACIATPLACQGIHVADGRELMIGESAEELAGALARVLADDALRSRLGEAARKHVLRHHTWTAVTDAYERLFESALEAGKRSAPA